jgi:Chaperone of endosialidase
MGNLVFQATLGGQVNLVGPNTASTFNINVPAVAGTMVTTGDTGTVTNTMLAGSIANAKLTNSSVTIGSTSVSLGATASSLAGLTDVSTSTLTASGAITVSGGTANGVGYLNASKVLTTGSALTFDGNNLGVSGDIFSSGSPLLYSYNGGTAGTVRAGIQLVGTDPSIRYYISGSEQMRLTSTGLGIGTSSPSVKLTVAAASPSVASRGTTYLYSTDSMAANLGGQLSFGGSYTGTSETIFGAVAGRKENGTAGDINGYLQFSTTNSSLGVVERARIDSSGNLLVGITSFTATTNANFMIYGGGSEFIGHASGTASGTQYLDFRYNGSAIGSITQSGTAAVLYNVTSDQRLKENIVDAPEFGSVIDSIQVRSYDWKSNGNHQRAGFIAQELVTVAPEAVHQPVDSEEMMAVDYSKLVPMLVKEIQSLRKRLAAAGI